MIEHHKGPAVDSQAIESVLGQTVEFGVNILKLVRSCGRHDHEEHNIDMLSRA